MMKISLLTHPAKLIIRFCQRNNLFAPTFIVLHHKLTTNTSFWEFGQSIARGKIMLKVANIIRGVITGKVFKGAGIIIYRTYFTNNILNMMKIPVGLESLLKRSTFSQKTP